VTFSAISLTPATCLNAWPVTATFWPPWAPSPIASPRRCAPAASCWIAGNGGSAADAQHVAAEFLSRFGFDRNPLPAIALTTDTSVLTAIGNDYGFEHVFERQVRGLGRKGDVLIAISTSGRSPNIIAALKAARATGMTTIGFSGSAGEMHALCDSFLAVPSKEPR
jgi:D-sedoheptulose 7-phosphate isomerase